MMQAMASSNGYTSGKVYIVWNIPHNNISGYEIERDGKIIASSFTEEPSVFISPTLFDHDHHTNLFKKGSTHQLMFIDENVQPYQKYEYKVIAKKLNDTGDIMEQRESKTIYVTAQ